MPNLIYMKAELKRLQKELEVATVYVTHDQAEAMTMGDRIVIMNYGMLQQLATPDKVYDSPEPLHDGFPWQPTHEHYRPHFYGKEWGMLPRCRGVHPPHSRHN